MNGRHPHDAGRSAKCALRYKASVRNVFICERSAVAAPICLWLSVEHSPLNTHSLARRHLHCGRARDEMGFASIGLRAFDEFPRN